MSRDGERFDWRWRTERGLEAVERLAGPWDALAREAGLTPAADATWMRCFWPAFGARDQDLFVHALFEGETLRAVLPLERRGRAASRWTSVANAHTPSWRFAFDPSRPEAAREILGHLLESAPGIELAPMPAADPALACLRDAARARGLLVSEEARSGDAVLDLAGPWEEFRRTFRTNLRVNTEKHTRSLEAKGALSYERVGSEPELSPALEECFELERRGWKGTHGSPVISDPRTALFYRELARRLAAAARFALYLLKLDGRIIAFEFGVRAHGRVDQLKSSYDPEWHSMSPGNVLRFFLLRDEIAIGEVHAYHIGRPSSWKMRWASRVEPLVRISIHDVGWRGRLGHLAGPALRQAVKKNAALAAAIRAARRRRG